MVNFRNPVRFQAPIGKDNLSASTQLLLTEQGREKAHRMSPVGVEGWLLSELADGGCSNLHEAAQNSPYNIKKLKHAARKLIRQGSIKAISNEDGFFRLIKLFMAGVIFMLGVITVLVFENIPKIQAFFNEVKIW